MVIENFNSEAYDCIEFECIPEDENRCMWDFIVEYE